MGVVVTLWHDRSRSEDLVSQHTLGLTQVPLDFLDWDSLALRSGSQVAVAIKVFGNRVLIVVAVQVDVPFGSMGVVHILEGKIQTCSI